MPAPLRALFCEVFGCGSWPEHWRTLWPLPQLPPLEQKAHTWSSNQTQLYLHCHACQAFQLQRNCSNYKMGLQATLAWETIQEMVLQAKMWSRVKVSVTKSMLLEPRDIYFSQWNMRRWTSGFNMVNMYCMFCPDWRCLSYFFHMDTFEFNLQNLYNKSKKIVPCSYPMFCKTLTPTGVGYIQRKARYAVEYST